MTHPLFSKDIPPQNILTTRSQTELNAQPTYLVSEQGLGLVTFEISSGKSTAVREFVSTLVPNRYGNSPSC